MKSKIIKHLVNVAHGSAVAVIVAALTVSTAGWASRPESYGVVVKPEPIPVVDGVVLTPGTPSVEQPRNNMTPKGKPTTHQVACFSIPYVNQSQNDKKLPESPKPAAFEVVSTDAPAHGPRELQSSICLISTEAGRQFTLVGAKPSGTS
ncbi:MAG: hypothetical protein AB1644_09795 [Candidatus Zixiibacteriota bacterium]